MSFPEFPFPTYLQSFVHHSKVLEYLQNYAKHYELERFIKLGTLVEQVTPLPIDCGPEREKKISDISAHEDEINFHNWGRFKDDVKWMVTTVDVDSGCKTTDEYDAIFVCNG